MAQGMIEKERVRSKYREIRRLLDEIIRYSESHGLKVKFEESWKQVDTVVKQIEQGVQKGTKLDSKIIDDAKVKIKEFTDKANAITSERLKSSVRWVIDDLKKLSNKIEDAGFLKDIENYNDFFD